MSTLACTVEQFDKQVVHKTKYPSVYTQNFVNKAHTSGIRML